MIAKGKVQQIGKFMSLTFVSRSSLPVLAKGAEGKNSVTVHSNGQISLSAKATKIIGEIERVAVGYDSESRKLVIVAATPNIIKQLAKKEADTFVWKVQKKSKTGFFAASALLQDPNGDVFGTDKYDYKASGNQTFEVEVSEKNRSVTFVVPNGAMKPKPVVPRKKKSVAPTPITTEANTAAAAGSDDLTSVLDATA